MDLNILFSLIVGFFLFRFQFWLGEARGLTVDDAYPYASEQNTGALLSYGLLTIFVARRFLWGTLREAWRGEKTGRCFPRGPLTCCCWRRLSASAC